MKSFYLCHSFSGSNSCLDTILPGQHNFTDEEYNSIVKQQLTELWTEYGNLTEVWVDSALGGFGDLMVKLQPQAVGTPVNPTGWCGTESGHPSKDVGPEDVWSTGGGKFGDPNASSWVPKFCDPQLFQEHVWFWEPNLKVRTLEMMIPIYHDIVGRGMVMELAFSIDRDGLVEGSHAKVYKQLGDWVRQCYGTPLALTSGLGSRFELVLPAGRIFDRFQLQEDIVLGQRVRNYTIESRTLQGPWKPLVSGSAIGQKRIHLLHEPISVVEALSLRLSISNAVALPAIKYFGVFAPCETGSEGDVYV
jgi:hypothetical protein